MEKILWRGLIGTQTVYREEGKKKKKVFRWKKKLCVVEENPIIAAYKQGTYVKLNSFSKGLAILSKAT